MKQARLNCSLVLLMAFAILFGFRGVASAHVLQENNGVSAVLHIPPEDNPVAAQPTSLHFSFSSERGNFSLENCNCQVTVRQNGNTIQTAPLKRSGSDALDAVALVRFPTIGVYDVLVNGSPKGTKFQSFRLDYLERVATSADKTTTTPNNQAVILLIGGTSFVILAMVAYARIKHGGRYKQSSPTKK